MKILWLCNATIPGIRKKLGMDADYGGGWLEETFEKLIQDDRNSYGFCAPFDGCKEMIRMEYSRAKYYGFKCRVRESHVYEARLEKVFKKITDEFCPDIVHIFGTEYPHALAMVRAFHHPERIVVHIQGLVFIWGGVIDRFFRQEYFTDGRLETF